MKPKLCRDVCRRCDGRLKTIPEGNCLYKLTVDHDEFWAKEKAVRSDCPMLLEHVVLQGDQR